MGYAVLFERLRVESGCCVVELEITESPRSASHHLRRDSACGVTVGACDKPFQRQSLQKKCIIYLIEGSLEVKLPTIWTDEKQRWEESEKRREKKRREEKRREEERRGEERRGEERRGEERRGEERREEKRREEERRSKKRKSQKKEDPGALKGRKVAKYCVFSNDLWLRRVEM